MKWYGRAIFYNSQYLIAFGLNNMKNSKFKIAKFNLTKKGGKQFTKHISLETIGSNMVNVNAG